MCGDCKCPENDYGEPTLEDAGCPLHSAASKHAELTTEPPRVPEDERMVEAVAKATWVAVFARNDFADVPPVARETYRKYALAAIRAINAASRGTP